MLCTYGLPYIRLRIAVAYSYKAVARRQTYSYKAVARRQTYSRQTTENPSSALVRQQSLLVRLTFPSSDLLHRQM